MKEKNNDVRFFFFLTYSQLQNAVKITDFSMFVDITKVYYFFHIPERISFFVFMMNMKITKGEHYHSKVTVEFESLVTLYFWSCAKLSEAK